MSKYLIKVNETYRVDSEREAAILIDEAKQSNDFTLAKYSSQKKETKQKGEIVDEWFRVNLEKVFTSEKEPLAQVTPTYSSEDSFLMR